MFAAFAAQHLTGSGGDRAFPLANEKESSKYNFPITLTFAKKKKLPRHLSPFHLNDPCCVHSPSQLSEQLGEAPALTSHLLPCACAEISALLCSIPQCCPSCPARRWWLFLLLFTLLPLSGALISWDELLLPRTECTNAMGEQFGAHQQPQPGGAAASGCHHTAAVPHRGC